MKTEPGRRKENRWVNGVFFNRIWRVAREFNVPMGLIANGKHKGAIKYREELQLAREELIRWMREHVGMPPGERTGYRFSREPMPSDWKPISFPSLAEYWGVDHSLLVKINSDRRKREEGEE
jgi:hypothetical protein